MSDGIKKISVVTICYNSESCIKQTIESVLNQTYKNIEYIIQDGASSDGTCDIIREYTSDERINFVSEKDAGIYNAMNKATDKATGDYIIFMNSGDVFYDEKTLEDICPLLEGDVVYGGVIREKREGVIEEKYKGKHHLLKLILIGRMPCHQSMFIRDDIMKKYRYNEEYRITADYDFTVRAYAKHLKMKYIDRYISRVENIEGVSAQLENVDIMRKHNDTILRRNMPLWYYLVTPPKKVYRKVIDRV